MSADETCPRGDSVARWLTPTDARRRRVRAASVESRFEVGGEGDLGLVAGFEVALHSLVHRLAEVLRAPEWRAIMPAMVRSSSSFPELSDVLHADRSEKFHILADVLAAAQRRERCPPTSTPISLPTF